jgi:hypothetical protein
MKPEEEATAQVKKTKRNVQDRQATYFQTVTRDGSNAIE